MSLETKTADIQAIDRFIIENTTYGRAPLVLEIRLRLLRDDSSLWRSFSNERNDSKTPRPYWAFAWSGGQALARYVLDHPMTVENKRVLDFGAGCGIASVAAGKAGAASVTASDIDPLSVRAIALNGQANKISIDTVCEDLIFGRNQGWDVILAGDIWYDTRLARHGLKWLRGFAINGVDVLIGDPGRTYSPSKGLKQLSSYTCRSVPDLEHPNLQQVSVYQLLPKKN